VERRLLLRVAAPIAGATALACFSVGAMLLLPASHISRAGAWAVLRLFYAAAGGILCGLATTRRLSAPRRPVRPRM
jgi:hypothetical protein